MQKMNREEIGDSMRFPISFFVYTDHPGQAQTEYAPMTRKHEGYRNDFAVGPDQLKSFLVSWRLLRLNYSKEYSCRNTTLR